MPMSADEALWRSLADLGQISDHLRERQRPIAANKIAKAANEAMLAFYEAELFGDDLHFSETVKNNFKARVGNVVSTPLPVEVPRKNDEEDCDTPGGVALTLSDIVSPVAVKGSDSNGKCVNVFIKRDRRGTWADIASVGPTVDHVVHEPSCAGSSVISTERRTSLNAQAPVFSPDSSVDESVSSYSAATPVDIRRLEKITTNLFQEITVELEHKARVVWVCGLAEGIESLSFISSKITTGPLNGIAWISAHKAYSVVFMFTAHAQSFLDMNERFTKENGESVYGSKVAVQAGPVVEWTRDIVRMEPPTRERRRLTIVKGKNAIFENDEKRRRFERDLARVAGNGNVELIWLFNSGNMTATFASTLVARQVRGHFVGRSREHGGWYEGINVTYSTDPCEKPLVLQTQVPGYLDFALRQPHLRHLAAAMKPAKPFNGGAIAAYKVFVNPQNKPGNFNNKANISNKITNKVNMVPAASSASNNKKSADSYTIDAPLMPLTRDNITRQWATVVTPTVPILPPLDHHLSESSGDSYHSAVPVIGSGPVIAGSKKWQTVHIAKRRK